MKRREFYNKLNDSVCAAIEKLNAKKEELEKVRFKIQDTKKYTPQHIAELRQRSFELEKEINDYQYEVNKAIKDACDEYAAELRRGDDLDPAKITDDAKLLNCGIKLKRADLEKMFDKYNGNTTMQRLVLSAAENAGISQFGRVVLPSESSQFARVVDGLPEAARVALKWYDKPGVYEKTFGAAAGDFENEE